MKSDTDKARAIKAYLKEINKLTKHCEVRLVDESCNEEVDSVHFEISIKPDPFYQYAHVTVSEKFEYANAGLFYKYFGFMPTYNNTHTSFWIYHPKYFHYEVQKQKWGD